MRRLRADESIGNGPCGFDAIVSATDLIRSRQPDKSSDAVINMYYYYYYYSSFTCVLRRREPPVRTYHGLTRSLVSKCMQIAVEGREDENKITIMKMINHGSGQSSMYPFVLRTSNGQYAHVFTLYNTITVAVRCLHPGRGLILLVFGIYCTRIAGNMRTLKVTEVCAKICS